MRAKIEKIGDGFGLLLPKELLAACGFGSEATVTLRDKELIVALVPRRPRGGWDEALRAIPQEELDRDFAELAAFRETPDEWDATEWQWPEGPRGRTRTSGSSRMTKFVNRRSDRRLEPTQNWPRLTSSMVSSPRATPYTR